MELGDFSTQGVPFPIPLHYVSFHTFYTSSYLTLSSSLVALWWVIATQHLWSSAQLEKSDFASWNLIYQHSCYAPLRRLYENWPKMACQQQPRFTITEFFIPALFFSNGRISETKQDFLNALVPKFSYRRGLSSPLS